jgi:hypothetical protein
MAVTLPSPCPLAYDDEMDDIEMMIALSVFALCYGFWLWRTNSLFL